MPSQAYGRLGMAVVGRIGRIGLVPAHVAMSETGGQGIVFRGRMPACEDSPKRWLSKTLCTPSQGTRFIVSSTTPSSHSPGCVSLQHGDSVNFDRLATCGEIFLVQKEFNVAETGSNIRREYKYEINDKMGEKMFDAVHMYETFPPKFDLKLHGPNGSLLINHKLLQNLSSHLLSMQIIRPGGMYVGSIDERLNLSSDKPPIFELKDSRDEVQAVVLTDFANTKLGFRRTIQILTADQTTVIGKISKKWGGFNDKLVVKITLPTPAHMNVQFRASLIGLCILLVKYVCL